jgi:DNA-binding IscR family transcriptional regulator
MVAAGEADAAVVSTAGVLVSGASRSLRRALRPIEWVVLEDIALDARLDGKGELVAPTSARRVAEHLGLTAGAVARALARLRSAGLVTHARQPGPVGRFGLSAYVLTPVTGLDVVHVADPDGAPPHPAPPRLAPPHIEPPRVVDAHMVEAVPADDEAPEPSGQARRSLHEDAVAAVAAPGQERAAQGRPSTVAGPAAKRSGRPVARPAAQLSMLDTTDDTEFDTDPEQCP